MATFFDRAITVIRAVPRGRVISYGQVAALAGSPRAALMVGQLLKNGSEKYDLPWQRVINSKGYISIVNMEFPAELQAELLRQEGIEVGEHDHHYRIDLQKYGWLPDNEVEK